MEPAIDKLRVVGSQFPAYVGVERQLMKIKRLSKPGRVAMELEGKDDQMLAKGKEEKMPITDLPQNATNASGEVLASC